jgi:hypothetical protein
MTLYVLNYNNYYNRILKKFDTINEYAEYIIYTLETANFNPSDGVNTQHVIGAAVPYDGLGDYLIAVNEFNEIVSRWFIIDGARVRGGQFQLNLRRDLLADFKTEVLNSPCFIEKATPSVYDHAIYNSENMTFNQIKTAEYPIKDQTETPWIVGYINRSLSEDKTITLTPNPYFDFSVDSLDNFEAYQKYKIGTSEAKEYNVNYWNVDYKWYSSGSYEWIPARLQFAVHDNIHFDKNVDITSTDSTFSSSQEYLDAPGKLTDALRAWYNTPERDDPLPRYYNKTKLLQCKDKIVRVGTGDDYKYYKMTESIIKHGQTLINVPETMNATQLYTAVASTALFAVGVPIGTRKGMTAYASYTEYGLIFTDITSQFVNTTVKISATRNRLSDAPYDMFCTPLNKLTLGDITYNKGELGLLIGQKIAQELTLGTGGNVFDIQLLPYCPLNGLEDLVDGGLALAEYREGFDYDYVKENNETIVSIIFYPNASSFTNVIYVDVPSPLTTDPVEFKVHNECDKWRLCSPNYASAFDFSLTKNEGLDYFEINCTYKPYNPYIHVNPNWGGLYGQDFNDARGLILQGDFSIAALNSAWEQYQLQNKNYEAIFNRQIQSMELKNSIQREREYWQYGTGIFQGGAAGATTAAMASGGNPYAAAAGAVVGVVGSAAGGARDLQLNEQLRNEALDYSKDMYSYNLGNIQALPNSLSKSSAFDINNKIFPFLEYYTCGTVEKNALRDKLKYNGFTIMRIGKLENFVQKEESYMKGKLIRIEDTIEDYHIVNELGREVNLGFFLKGDN